MTVFPTQAPTCATTPLPTQRNGARKRTLPPSAPGVRWTLSRELRVRFAKDLARIHTAQAPYRNFVKLTYSTPVTDRPTDEVLAALVKLAAGAPDDPTLAVGRRCWLLTQTPDGWTLALELRGGPQGRTVTPGRDADGAPLGVAIDHSNPPAVVTAARALLEAAVNAAANPDSTDVHPVVLQRLKTAW